jgi:DNA-binding MarR family transcriptional regulator/GNAT superfamily N-acetyltransferase
LTIPPADIDAVREFNRFYTARLGLARSKVYKSQFSLVEARVLYELGTHGMLRTGALRRKLTIDAGQLSRVLSRLEDEELVQRTPYDGRSHAVVLTSYGKKAFAALDERSREEVTELLRRARSPQAAITAMRQLRRALEPAKPDTFVRFHAPGDLGWLIERHGALYAREYGWDESFERLVARIVADFDPSTDCAWIAEVGGERVGGVLCVHHDDTTAKLRTLLVEPSARGRGIGAMLVRVVVAHAQQRGYTTLSLWTNDVLHAARKIYERAGFELQSERPHHAFGHDLVEQTWSLTLPPWTETH